MVAPINILCTTSNDIKYIGCPENDNIPIVTNTEHCIIKVIIIGLITDLNVNATTIKIDTMVSNVIKFNSDWKEFDISNAIGEFPIKYLSFISFNSFLVSLI